MQSFQLFSNIVKFNKSQKSLQCLHDWISLNHYKQVQLQYNEDLIFPPNGTYRDKDNLIKLIRSDQKTYIVSYLFFVYFVIL